jgi:hypothetical protein
VNPLLEVLVSKVQKVRNGDKWAWWNLFVIFLLTTDYCSVCYLMSEWQQYIKRSELTHSCTLLLSMFETELEKTFAAQKLTASKLRRFKLRDLEKFCEAKAIKVYSKGRRGALKEDYVTTLLDLVCLSVFATHCSDLRLQRGRFDQAQARVDAGGESSAAHDAMNIDEAQSMEGTGNQIALGGTDQESVIKK